MKNTLLMVVLCLLIGCELSITKGYKCTPESAEQRKDYFLSCRKVGTTIAECKRQAEWLYCEDLAPPTTGTQ